MWWLLKTLVAFLFLALFVVFLVQNNELVSLWPLTNVGVEKIGTSVVYFVLFCFGYFCGRFSAWSAYAPLRSMLRKQKKENKVLSKEHEKLNHEHEKLNQQYTTLQEETDKAEKAHKSSFSKKIKGWFAKPSKEE